MDVFSVWIFAIIRTPGPWRVAINLRIIGNLAIPDHILHTDITNDRLGKYACIASARRVVGNIYRRHNANAAIADPGIVIGVAGGVLRITNSSIIVLVALGPTVIDLLPQFKKRLCNSPFAACGGTFRWTY